MSDPRSLLSVVYACPLGARSLAHVWPFLEAQTIADRVEVVLAGPRDRVDPPGAVGAFHSVRIVEMETPHTLAEGNAAGARHASAPIVAFGEDHAFPDPGWAAALVTAHAEDRAVVGPAVRMADPDGPVAWADFVLGYGPWAEPVEAGPRDYLPGHNSSYRWEVLAAEGERLAERLSVEFAFHRDLRRDGHELWLEPAARIRHLDYGRVRPWIAATYLAGRTFAGRRCTRWTAGRRFAFVIASPLVPLVRLRRSLADLRRIGGPARALPALVGGVIIDGLGQLVGAIAGPGSAPRRLSSYEHERVRHVRAGFVPPSPGDGG